MSEISSQQISTVDHRESKKMQSTERRNEKKKDRERRHRQQRQASTSLQNPSDVLPEEKAADASDSDVNPEELGMDEPSRLPCNQCSLL